MADQPDSHRTSYQSFKRIRRWLISVAGALVLLGIKEGAERSSNRR